MSGHHHLSLTSLENAKSLLLLGLARRLLDYLLIRQEKFEVASGNNLSIWKG